MKRAVLFGILLAMHASASFPATSEQRPVIYQLLVRTFGNTHETRKTNGTMRENGCGKFNDINDAALASIKDLGVTHVWLTGVHEQASGTAYPSRPADDPNILKGIAGSPYAIKDYFDVCPDYAMYPEKRLDEFRDLLVRCRRHGLRVIIDFVPNHVARSYISDVKPESSFGAGDKQDVFFDRNNHFFYLTADSPGDGPPLKLPTAHLPGCDGSFPPEAKIGKVTGNNGVSWSPSIHDWYETVKLNYGHDFTQGRDTSALPAEDASIDDIPKTWRTMDEILAYWQAMGIDGFRADMAHMVPMEFWRWAVKRAKSRQSNVFFSAEAYDNDPAKLCEGHVLDELLKAGFDAVYDDPVYDVLEGLYDSGRWANDLDSLTFTGPRFHQSLRYGENHDEVRLASPKEWGGLGMKVGKPVCAALFSMGRGPVMIYHGQEVGEPAAGEEGFGGDDARTTIFDYWSMPEFTKWVNGGSYDGARLSQEQRDLRAWYGKLIRATQTPAFTAGDFYGLNHVNSDNENFGRIDGETASGHWLYAFLRHDAKSGESCLVISNFHGTKGLKNVRVTLPENAITFMGRQQNQSLVFKDRLDSQWTTSVAIENLTKNGLALPDLEPCSAMILEISK